RFDHQVNNNNLLTARINIGRFSDTNPADAVANNVLPSAGRRFRKRTYAAQLSDTATLSNWALNEAHFQFQLGDPITQFEPINPSTQFVRAGVSTEGESRAGTLINHQYQMKDTISFSRGRHNLRVGGDFIYSSSGGDGQEFGGGFVKGQFTFRPNAGCNNQGVNCQPTSTLTLTDVLSFTQSFGSQA